MMRGIFVFLFSLVLVLPLAVGCQTGGDSAAPVYPQGTGGLQTTDASRESGGGIVAGKHHLLALVHVRIDASTGRIEVTDLRTARQHLNLLQLIPIYCPPSNPCLEFVNLVIDTATATCDLDVKVRHPINDPTLDVFDMRGIGIFKSTLDAGFTGGAVATQILNADGWTTAYDQGGVFDAFLNPYVAYNTDQPKRVFTHGSVTFEHITCRFPSLNPSDTQFQYALDGSWYDPALYDPFNPATDPNMPEPYQVKFLYLGPVPSQAMGKATAVVEVLDWQKNAAGSGIECPALFSGPREMTEAWSGGGRYLFYADLTNEKAAGPGTYPLLVKARDEFDYQPDLINPTIQVELANYQLGSVEVYDSSLNTAPVASANASQTVIIAGGTVHFDASSSYDAEDGAVSSYLWDLNGDWVFNEGTAAEADYQYVLPGTYSANVLVTDSQGLTDILDLPITIQVNESVNNPPVASAFVSNTHPIKGQSVTLDASASTDTEDGKPVSWKWEVDNDGDYNDISGEVVQYAWSTAGTYMVDVRVMDSGGLTDTLDSKIQVVVQDSENTPPVAVAQANKTTAAVGETVIFDGSSSYDAEDTELSQFAWDLLGKKTYSDAYTPIVPYKFWAPGTYEIDLRVTDSGGLSDTLDTLLTVEITGPPNQPPVAIAHASDTLVWVDQMIQFDGSASFDPEEGKVASYKWDLDGDGFYFDAFTEKVSWAYHQPGIYNVDLMVSDTPGLTDTLSNPLVIQVISAGNNPPVAVAQASKYFGYEGDTIYFDGSGSYDPEDGAPTSWGWEFDGDNDYNDSPFIIAAYTYNTAGDYLVDLKVTDKDGVFDMLDVPLSIKIVPQGSNFPPNAEGKVSCSVPVVGQAVQFSSQSTDADGSIVKWEWDFKEGAGWQDFSSTQGNAWHAFSDEGVYQVELRVTDDDGGVDTLDAPITVLVQFPQYNPPSGAPSCGAGLRTHTYASALPFSTPNTTVTSRDVAFLKNGSYLVVVADALYQVLMPANLKQPPLLYDTGWVKSIDTSGNNLVALSGLDDGKISIYSAKLGPTVTLDFVTEIDMGEPIYALAFDDTNALRVYTAGLISSLRAPLYQPDPCSALYVPQIESYGVVQDMEYCLWNHSLYLVIDDGNYGTVVEVDHIGQIGAVKSNVLPGPTRYLDIIIDKNLSNEDESACRIEVVGGIYQGYVTRLDADLKVLDTLAYGFWGIRAAALAPTPTNELVALEDCCISWVDLLIPPVDWEDMSD